MNKCCYETLQKLQDELANLSGALIKMSGNCETLMEEAAYRRAEIVVDVMALIKKYTQNGTIK